MKPKINRAGDPQESKGFDRCNTPAYALDPLLPYINLIGAYGSRQRAPATYLRPTSPALLAQTC